MTNNIHTVPAMESSHERIASLQSAVADAEERAERAERELATFKERVHSVGGRYAERHEWCETYDEIMGELGLPGRVQDWDVIVRVHASYATTISAISLSDAQDQVSEQMISRDWKSAQPFGDLSISTSPGYDVSFEVVDE